MTIRRVVPDISSEVLSQSRRFYQRLGLVEVMNLGWGITLASPTHPTAQVTLMGPDATPAIPPEVTIESDDVDAVHAAMGEDSAQVGDATAAIQPDVTIEVDDVDAVHAAMVEDGAQIVHPLQDESWGVRRFFVTDPNGRVINVVGHN